MGIIQTISFIIAVLTRLALGLTSVAFLFRSAGFTGEVLRVIGGKISYGGFSDSLDPVTSIKLNLYGALFFVLGASSVLLACYGLYVAAWSERRRVTRLIFISLQTLLLCVFIIIAAASSFKEINDETLPNLRTYQAGYIWGRISPPSQIGSAGREATMIWDSLQGSLHCCGFRSPNDWAIYRPSRVQEGLLPWTCCRNLMDPTVRYSGFCRPGAIWETGCHDRVNEIIIQLSKFIWETIRYSMLSSLVAIFILICSHSMEEDVAMSHGHPPSGGLYPNLIDHHGQLEPNSFYPQPGPPPYHVKYGSY